MTGITTILEQERDDLQETDLCQQASNIVTLRGSHNPAVVFVGEAPGRQEDQEGKPFVGRAGTILEDWIDELGVEEYAITNVVKCRPPDNRTPSQSEIERFGTWLERELDALNPSVIIPLGKTATEFLLPETKERPFLDQVCYQEYENEHGSILPMPHPAYALRSGHKPPFEQVNDMIEG